MFRTTQHVHMFRRGRPRFINPNLAGFRNARRAPTLLTNSSFVQRIQSIAPTAVKVSRLAYQKSLFSFAPFISGGAYGASEYACQLRTNEEIDWKRILKRGSFGIFSNLLFGGLASSVYPRLALSSTCCAANNALIITPFLYFPVFYAVEKTETGKPVMLSFRENVVQDCQQSAMYYFFANQ